MSQQYYFKNRRLMRITAILGIFLVCASVCSSQDSTNAPTALSQQQYHPVTIGGFYECIGYGPTLASVNGEVQFTLDTGRVHSKLGARVGYAVSLYYRRMIPMMLTYTIGATHKLEVGGGVTATYGIVSGTSLSTDVYRPAAHVGWRYEQTGGGWLFRGVITSLYDAGYNRFYTMFGLSAGAQIQFGK